MAFSYQRSANSISVSHQHYERLSPYECWPLIAWQAVSIPYLGRSWQLNAACWMLFTRGWPS